MKGRVIIGRQCWVNFCSWWRHQMETFSELLALCEGNPPVTGGFPSQRPVTRSFDVFFDPRLNKRSSKHRDGGDLRHHRVHYDVTVMFITWRCAQSQGAPYCQRLAWFRAVISPEHQHCSTGDIAVLCKAVSIDTAHWDRYKMATISQKTFSNAFFWMTIYEFRLRYHGSLLLVPINNIPTLVQIMAGRPGDGLNSEPVMASLLTHICVTRPQWVKAICPQNIISCRFVLLFPSLFGWSYLLCLYGCGS